jgi:RNA recognition motif-containing protein
MTDRDTGLSQGFAFVEMTGAEAARAIAALDGTIVDGQTIKVREGRPKRHRGSLPEYGVPQPPETLTCCSGGLSRSRSVVHGRAADTLRLRFGGELASSMINRLAPRQTGDT